MTDGDEWARESWAVYLADGTLAASERSGGPHLYRSPDQAALFWEIARRALCTYPIQSMRAQSLVRRAKIENSARAASRRRQAEADEPNNVWVSD